MAENRVQGGLGIIALKSTREISKKVDEELVKRREFREGIVASDSYIMKMDDIRFSNGEGKLKISETARGRDLYILCDVGNYSCKYNMYGFENQMGPDEHFQDIKRALSAIGGMVMYIGKTRMEQYFIL